MVHDLPFEVCRTLAFPLIVAHPKRSTAELQTIVRSFLGHDPRVDVGALLMGLREGKAAPVTNKAPGR